jgi:DNA-binding response OmpR family regulator
VQRLKSLVRSGAIIVVEDDESIAALMMELLNAQGYRCLTARTASAGYDLVENQLPDLLILDLVLGGVPAGWRLLDQLSRNRHTSTIAVIVCTADTNALRSHATVLRERGIHLMAKPFEIDELVRLAAHVLGSRNTGARSGQPNPTTGVADGKWERRNERIEALLNEV